MGNNIKYFERVDLPIFWAEDIAVHYWNKKVEYYSVSFAVGRICFPKLGEIVAIYLNGDLIFNISENIESDRVEIEGLQYFVHDKADSFLPERPNHPILSSANQSILSNYFYIYFEDLRLTKFGGRIPTVTCVFECTI